MGLFKKKNKDDVKKDAQAPVAAPVEEKKGPSIHNVKVPVATEAPAPAEKAPKAAKAPAKAAPKAAAVKPAPANSSLQTFSERE